MEVQFAENVSGVGVSYLVSSLESLWEAKLLFLLGECSLYLNAIYYVFSCLVLVTWGDCRLMDRLRIDFCSTFSFCWVIVGKAILKWTFFSSSSFSVFSGFLSWFFLMYTPSIFLMVRLKSHEDDRAPHDLFVFGIFRIGFDGREFLEEGVSSAESWSDC